jgi:hypothetical protein
MRAQTPRCLRLFRPRKHDETPAVCRDPKRSAYRAVCTPHSPKERVIEGARATSASFTRSATRANRSNESLLLARGPLVGQTNARIGPESAFSFASADSISSAPLLDWLEAFRCRTLLRSLPSSAQSSRQLPCKDHGTFLADRAPHGGSPRYDARGSLHGSASFAGRTSPCRHLRSSPFFQMDRDIDA